MLADAGTATPLDSPKQYVEETTLVLPDGATIHRSLREMHPRLKTAMISQPQATLSNLVPLTLRSPPPLYQGVSDRYVNEETRFDQETSQLDPVIDSLMPLYLSEELSPRFAKHKVASAWRARQSLVSSTRARVGKVAVHQWELGGRDAGLRDIMDSDEAGLEGVSLRPRTVEEVREAAMVEHDEEVRAENKFVKEQIVKGMFWHTQKGEWVSGHKARRAERKKVKKAEKKGRIEEKMAKLRLQPARNMVLPPELVEREGGGTGSAL